MPVGAGIDGGSDTLGLMVMLEGMPVTIPGF